MGCLRAKTLGLRRSCSMCFHLLPLCVLITSSAVGAETTSAVLAWWMLAMVTYPEVQKHAQEELDAVVGRTRIPTYADLPHLQYIRAMVKEVLRWRPVDPLGLPHLSTKDDWYNGMFIPKGSMMIAHIWCLNRDPEIYGADAAHFNPARFLDANGEVISLAQETKEEGHVSYGFGTSGSDHRSRRERVNIRRAAIRSLLMWVGSSSRIRRTMSVRRGTRT